MCALSVLLFTAQLYVLPEHMSKEVVGMTLKFMLGLGFMGRAGMHGSKKFDSAEAVGPTRNPRYF